MPKALQTTAVRAGRATSLLCALAQLTACASISVEQRTELRPRPQADAAPLASVPARARDRHGHRVTSRTLTARASQRGAALVIALAERRACQRVERVPVVRTQIITRRAGPGLYIEYALAALAYGFASYALSRPASLSSAVTTDENGDIVADKTPGHVVGGLFLALGTGALGAAIYDTVRARDERLESADFVVLEGPAIPCDPVAARADGYRVTLELAGFRADATTDEDGEVRFTLPDTLDRPGLGPSRHGAPAPQAEPTPGPTLEPKPAPTAKSEPGGHDGDARPPANANAPEILQTARVRVESRAGETTALQLSLALPFARTLDQPRLTDLQPALGEGHAGDGPTANAPADATPSAPRATAP